MSTTLDLVKDPVTTKQAADLLDVSRWAVLKALHQGRLTGEMLGRDYLIEREEVERYARERKLTGPRKRRPSPPPVSEYRYPVPGDHAATARIVHQAADTP